MIYGKLQMIDVCFPWFRTTLLKAEIIVPWGNFLIIRLWKYPPPFLTHEYPTIQVTSSCHMATTWHPFLLGFIQGHSSYRWSEKEGSALYTWTIYQVVLLLVPIFQPISLFDVSRFAPTIHTKVNSSVAGDRIFRLWRSIPCLLMP